MKPHAIYLHGFASGPQTSAKARFLGEALADAVASFRVPDLEGDDFLALTMDHRRERAQAAIDDVPADGAPLLLIGSSLGAYQAARLAAAKLGRIGALLLIAPAFAFIERWTALLGDAEIEAWERTGRRLFYHYRSDSDRPLGVDFLRSCRGLPGIPLSAGVPTVVVHGRQDEAADYHAAWRYAEQEATIELHLLTATHALDTARQMALIVWCARDLIRRLEEPEDGV